MFVYVCEYVCCLCVYVQAKWVCVDVCGYGGVYGCECWVFERMRTLERKGESWSQRDRVREEITCHILYIYIHIYFFKKNKNWSHYDYKFISILLWVLIWINNTQNNKTSSDLMCEIIQNRHRKEGWEGVEEGWKVSTPFRPLPVFSFYYRLEL